MDYNTARQWAVFPKMHFFFVNLKNKIAFSILSTSSCKTRLQRKTFFNIIIDAVPRADFSSYSV